MGWWSKSNDKEILKNSSLQRCKKILDQAENGIKTHSFWEKTWTIIHSGLAILISVFSTLSAIFTFYQNTKISIGFSITSAILAALMIALDPPPSERARRNRIIKNKYNRLDTNTHDAMIKIESMYKRMEESELIQLVEYLINEHEKILSYIDNIKE
jgi:hypothetical protein